MMKYKCFSAKRSKGFTLLEMLLVGVIIAVIGAIAARQYGTVSASNKANDTVLAVRTLHASVSAYKQDNGAASFPTITNLTDGGYLSDNGAKTPWGSDLALSATSGAGTYTITVPTVPSTALCQMIYGRLNTTKNTKAGENVTGPSGSGSTVTCTQVVVTYPNE